MIKRNLPSQHWYCPISAQLIVELLIHFRMPSSLLLLDSVEITERVYHFVDDWNDRFQFSLVNSIMAGIAFNRNFGKTYDISDNIDKNSLNSFPAKTASIIRLNLKTTVQNAFVDSLLEKYVNCKKVVLNDCPDSLISEFIRVCKTVTKRGLQLEINNCNNPAFDEIIKKYELKYLKQYIFYAENSRQRTPLKRKLVDTELVEVSIDTQKRQIFYLNESLKIAQGEPYMKSEFLVKKKLKSVIPKNVEYKRVNVDDLKSTFQPLHKTSTLFKDIEQFVGCILQFKKQYIYITSFDLFCHKQPLSDDCAYDSIFRFEKKPLAQIKQKTSKDKSFKELSIFCGLYELLAVGGYVLTEDNCLIPFLGSSLPNLNLDEATTSSIYVATTPSLCITTHRLLQQYLKDHSFKLWGYHCLESYNKGFTPIIPTDYGNHPLQKYQSPDTHHFASMLLHLLCDHFPITNTQVLGLFYQLIQHKAFHTISKKHQQYPINFNEFNDILLRENNLVYLKSLVKTAAIIESRTLVRPCFFLSIFKMSEAKNIALDIMKGGLLYKIRRSNLAIVKSVKESLNFM